MIYKFAGIFFILFIVSCAFTGKNTKNKNQEIDGIIYLDEDDEAQLTKAKKKRQAVAIERKSSKEPEQEKIEEVRDFKKMDGIIYLNYEDQASEIADNPLKPNHSLQTGKASFYSMKLSGRKTANGERYNPNKYTAAHPSLPFGTKVRVTNLYNNLSVTVKINDRGPYQKSRIIDLSYIAADKLDMISSGICDVAIEIIQNN